MMIESSYEKRESELAAPSEKEAFKISNQARVGESRDSLMVPIL